jgi:hypothetical protein
VPLALADALLAASAPPDPSAWSSLLCDTVTLRIGSRPVRVGRHAAEGELGWLFAKIAGFSRRFRYVCPAKDGMTVLMELEAMPIDRGEMAPLAVVLRPLGGEKLVADLRLYLDTWSLIRSDEVS